MTTHWVWAAITTLLIVGCAQRGPTGPTTRAVQLEHSVEPRRLTTRMGENHVPSLTAYLPATPNGTAVIVCPGGGYGALMDTYEGQDVCRWWNDRGVAAFLLRYRIAPDRYPAALDDVRAAVRTVRDQAGEFGVDPDRVGVMGFSAGGHLAGCAATMWRDPQERPDFAVLVYPVISLVQPFGHLGSRDNLLGKDFAPGLDGALSLEHRVTDRTPPCFIVHGRNDKIVDVRNAELFASSLKSNGVPHDLQILDNGPHGFGLKTPDDQAPWTSRCEAFLRSAGALPADR